MSCCELWCRTSSPRVWVRLQSCLCSRCPSAPSVFLLSLQGETVVSPRYESEQWHTTVLLIHLNSFLGCQSCLHTWARYPKLSLLFFLKLSLEELCQSCFYSNEALPFHLCAPEYWKDTLKWNYWICFMSKYRLFLLLSMSPVIFRISINNKIVQLNLKHKCLPAIQQTWWWRWWG